MTSSRSSATQGSSESQDSGPFFEQTWDLSYRHSLGQTVGRFLEGLRQEKLLGRQCPACERVLFPARSFCDRCHTDTEQWVEVAARGTLEMFTIVHEPFVGAVLEPPYVLAYALLEGADTSVVGFLKGLDLTDETVASRLMTPGTRVEVRFVDEPEGRVTDFWFELASE